jgi:hypothetical protein
MKIETLDRAAIDRLLKAGWTIRTAGLYEPDHAPKGTRFARAQYTRTLVRFVRLIPPRGEA